MENQGSTESSNISGEELFHLSTTAKTLLSVNFQVSFEYRSQI